MNKPVKLHYDHNPRTGEPKFPCNNQKPQGGDTTPILDLITCDACIIALVHTATTVCRQAA